MARTEWKQKHLKAFKKYLKGEPMAQIGTDLDIPHTTLYRWELRGNWKTYLDKQTTELMRQTSTEIMEEKERSLKLIKAAESYWAQKLSKGELEPDFNDLAALQKVKWDILSPRNPTQFNFLKQEQVINQPKYILKIIKPDDNQPDNNGMEAEQEAIGSITDSTGQ